MFIYAGVHLDAPSAQAQRLEVSEIIDERAPVVVLREEATYIVRVGPFDDTSQAERYQFLLIAADQNAPLIVRDTQLDSNQESP